VAQLDNVHSVLRLNYETLRGLISLASPSVAKPTVYGTSGSCRFLCCVSRASISRRRLSLRRASEAAIPIDLVVVCDDTNSFSEAKSKYRRINTDHSSVASAKCVCTIAAKGRYRASFMDA
jgi:hypothetical protein